MAAEAPKPAETHTEESEAPAPAEASAEKKQSPAEAMAEASQYDDPLECPCIADMKKGSCGPQFIEAYSCFLNSKEEEKGSDCYDHFKAMQKCMWEHPEEYEEFLKPPSDGEEDDEEEEEEEETASKADEASTAEDDDPLTAWLNSASQDDTSK